MPELPHEILEKFKTIRLLAFDSDGVLTDGGIYVAGDGQEFRRFDIKDGAGIKAVMALGIKVAVISSGKSLAVLHRCQQLGIQEVFTGVEDKQACLRQICERYSIELDQVCYMGDDQIDLPVLVAVGVSCAPVDAVSEVKTSVSFITTKAGGQGAVREVCDWVIDASQSNF
jgi:3-deoxy-D-manno-octulosonate 8-phosphate phosphatase (KDO 8-P phosphatase)